jgi:hypothetical protein
LGLKKIQKEKIRYLQDNQTLEKIEILYWKNTARKAIKK